MPGRTTALCVRQPSVDGTIGALIASDHERTQATIWTEADRVRQCSPAYAEERVVLDCVEARHGEQDATEHDPPSSSAANCGGLVTRTVTDAHGVDHEVQQDQHGFEGEVKAARSKAAVRTMKGWSAGQRGAARPQASSQPA